MDFYLEKIHWMGSCKASRCWRGILGPDHQHRCSLGCSYSSPTPPGQRHEHRWKCSLKLNVGYLDFLDWHLLCYTRYLLRKLVYYCHFLCHLLFHLLCKMNTTEIDWIESSILYNHIVTLSLYLKGKWQGFPLLARHFWRFWLYGYALRTWRKEMMMQMMSIHIYRE